MTKYRISALLTLPLYLEVEADSLEEAEDKALELDLSYSIEPDSHWKYDETKEELDTFDIQETEEIGTSFEYSPSKE